MTDTIPPETLASILELRKSNGLEPTEQAVYSDLAASKAAWSLEEKKRYRRAGKSPLFISGKYLSAKGIDPATGERDASDGKEMPTGQRENEGEDVSAKIDPTAFYKVLHGKGFAVKLSKNLITEKIETDVPASIQQLNLQFSAIPSNAKGIHITQTSPQIQVAMSLDKFLELAGLKPGT